MPLPSGLKLGPYEILAPVGAGGMGEVYRARDTQLDRTVAIKVLPEAFSEDPERLARFEREAKLLASLHHPNIATLFGFDRAGTRPFITMEMVPGETLAERIAKGPLPLDEALPLFVQIAQGLEDAHLNGVVHRDLKPANIKLTPQGKVKILDFGLAKAFAASIGEDGQDTANSPTITAAAATLRGEVMGTAAYMSPEQARGKSVDKRTDIWAFGCVLFEALSGISPFRGETITDTLAAIVRAEPDWKHIPAETPLAIRRLLRRCLEKDVNRRLHDIADARIELEEAMAGPRAEDAPSGVSPSHAPAAGVSGGAPSRRTMFLALAGTAIAAASVAVLATSALLRDRPHPSEPTRHFLVGSYDLVAQSAPEFSPDGESIVFSATESGARKLYRRSFRETGAVPIAGTEEGSAPFFSPDGEWIGFTTGRALKRVPVSGGTALTICNEQGINSANWVSDGSIYYTSLSGGIDGRTALSRISEAGGRSERIAEIDSAGGETECWLPEVLPGGKWVLLTSRRGSNWRVEAVRLKDGARRVLHDSGVLSRYVHPNSLLVADIQSQAAVVFPFDAERAEITGDPKPLSGEIDLINGFDVSQDGKLASVSTAGRSKDTVVWVNRDGTTSPLLETPGRWIQPRLLPGGRDLVVRQIAFPNCDLWLYEAERRALTRVTHEDDCHDPILSPDGRRVVFSRVGSGSQILSFVALDGSGPVESLGPKTERMRPESWSGDGRWLLATIEGQRTRRDVWIVPLDGASEPTPLFHSEYSEESPAFSPDGKWIAYTSDESGRAEVYVRPNPGPGPRVKVSTEGGQGALWTRDGREIVFASGDKMMASSFAPGPEPRAGVPMLLFSGAFGWDLPRDYDVLPDGSRFAMVHAPAGGSSRKEIWITLNWPSELSSHSRSTRVH